MPRHTCTECKRPFIGPEGASACKQCQELVDYYAQRAKDVRPLSERTCAHCLRRHAVALPLVRIASGETERWCPLCLSYCGERYAARVVEQ